MFFRTVIFILCLPFAAVAEGTPRLVAIDDAGSGSLMLKTDEPGRYVAAPLVATDITVDITGPLARTRITQRFRNPADVWVEGVYVFPLPQDSAVDTLRMRIGDRFIEGRIEEKAAARAEFEQAKTDGKRAALVEQLRPNMFTNSVANIGPGEVIVTQIEYQQALTMKDGVFGLRIPLVVAPRYNPDPIVQQAHFGASGWAVSAPQPPIAPEHDETLTNPVTLSIALAAGFEIETLDSPSHQVSVTDEDTLKRIKLTGPAPADRDFVLEWGAKTGAAPQAALFGETVDETAYRLLMVTPPALDGARAIPPRDVIFIQDVSGSMSGESIRQARAGLLQGLSRLRPEDRFNLVIFNDEFRVYSNVMVHATPTEVREVLRAIEGLEAGGGTEMAPALNWALSKTSDVEGRLRQIIFLTDGSVGNDEEMLALIRSKLGKARLFTVGIGSAPNSYFMTRAAEIGRGAHVYIGDVAEVTAKMDALFAKIENPVMTDLKLSLPAGTAAEVYPNPLPDLYAGDPLVIAIKADATDDAVLSGARDGAPWQLTIPLAQAADRPGVGKLWARAKIKGLEAERLAWGRGDARGEQVIDGAILNTALTHGLTSRMTSLIAVDTTPVRPDGESLTSAEVALNLPAGWDRAVFLGGGKPLPPQKRASLAPLSRAAAASPAPAGVPVPKGSADWFIWVMIGGLLIIGGAGLSMHRRERA
ncbi:MAG: marine proteobacterial sortase target protein [Pikeienuella sp.]